MITEPTICPHCQKPEPWLIPQYDTDTLQYDCCGKEVDMSPSQYVCEFGKYKGKNLDEIDDEWYLKFLLKIAGEKEDWVLQKYVNLKLRK